MTVHVAAAVLFDKKRFLICQRPVGKARALLWEFPGGKLEVGETLEQCVQRECREELGISIQVDGRLMDIEHAYPDLTVKLTVFLAHIQSGTPQLLEHNACAWIACDQIDDYTFCPADEPILQRLKNDQPSLPNCVR